MHTFISTILIHIVPYMHMLVYVSVCMSVVVSLLHLVDRPLHVHLSPAWSSAQTDRTGTDVLLYYIYYMILIVLYLLYHVI